MNLFITGANGFVGQHVVKYFQKDHPSINLFIPTRSELDLRLYPEMCQYISRNEITDVIHLAARVGGIGANKNFPAQFFYDNLYLSINVMHAASQFTRIERFINIGTICSYPKHTPVPFKEEELWNGYPEETNAPYGIANKAAIVYGQALNDEYGLSVMNLLPVNMTGEFDNFDPAYSHVIPAIILKIDRAMDNGDNEVNLWGTGTATREFLYAGDMAIAVRKALEIDSPDSSPINIGTGKEISIRDLADCIADIMLFNGTIIFTGQVSDGQPRRCLDTQKAKDILDFEAKTSFAEMLGRSVSYYYELKKTNPDLINDYMRRIS